MPSITLRCETRQRVICGKQQNIKEPKKKIRIRMVCNLDERERMRTNDATSLHQRPTGRRPDSRRRLHSNHQIGFCSKVLLGVIIFSLVNYAAGNEITTGKNTGLITGSRDGINTRQNKPLTYLPYSENKVRMDVSGTSRTIKTISSNKNPPQVKPIIKNLHQSSLQEAAKNLENNSTNNVDTLLLFKNSTCQEMVLDNIINYEQNEIKYSDTSPENKDSVLKWASHNSDTNAAILKTTKNGFKKVLAESVKNAECIKSVSVETANLKPILRSSKVVNDLNLERQNIKFEMDSNDVCRKTANDVLSIHTGFGRKHLKVQEVECKKRIVIYKRPSDDILNTPLAKAAENVCADKIGFISEEIPLDSSVSSSVNKRYSVIYNSINNDVIESDINEQQGGGKPLIAELNTISEMYITSALRRCPNIQFDVFSSRNNISGSEVRPEILTSHVLIKYFDFILNLPFETRPTNVVILEKNENPLYQPCSALVIQLLSDLKKLGVTVHLHAATSNSWLSSIPGMITGSSISEQLVKTEGSQLNLMMLAISLSVFGVFSFIVGGSLYIVRKKMDKYNVISNKTTGNIRKDLNLIQSIELTSFLTSKLKEDEILKSSPLIFAPKQTTSEKRHSVENQFLPIHFGDEFLQGGTRDRTMLSTEEYEMKFLKGALVSDLEEELMRHQEEEFESVQKKNKAKREHLNERVSSQYQGLLASTAREK